MYLFTEHSSSRSAERFVSDWEIDATLRYGQKRILMSVIRFELTQEDVKNNRLWDTDVRNAIGTVVVCDARWSPPVSAFKILTVYKQNQ
ncbi:MAG: hypothetical protein H6507_00145 [Calditrichaeota bacterium]|nr:hypothetical protein [Calditrichota bacterium]